MIITGTSRDRGQGRVLSVQIFAAKGNWTPVLDEGFYVATDGGNWTGLAIIERGLRLMLVMSTKENHLLTYKQLRVALCGRSDMHAFSTTISSVCQVSEWLGKG